MKAHIYIPVLLLALFFIASCKDKEDGTQRQLAQTFTYSQNIRGSAGVKGELPLPELKLADVIGDDTARNLTHAELQLAESYLEITGLGLVDSPDTVAVVLEDFTIKVGTRQPVNLGNFSTAPVGTNEMASDVKYSTNQVVNLVQNIFTEITSGNKRTNITVSFMPNVDITSADNVQLRIHFGGVYYYLVFD
jgi:hypothetical protein